MAAKYPDRSLPWPIIWAGVELIAESETCVLKAYRCAAGVLTIGWGETVNVRQGMEWTQQKADQEFVDELSEYVEQIRPMCTFPPDDHELAALASLTWNIGLEGLRGSTVLKCHNRGDKEAAARAFKLWDKATIDGKKVALPGLVTRRAREAGLYLTPDAHALPEPMPQAVSPESTLGTSPIAQGGAVTAITGAATVAASVSDQIGTVATQVNAAAASVGVSPILLLGIGLAAAGGVIVYYRSKQRAEGWA